MPKVPSRQQAERRWTPNASTTGQLVAHLPHIRRPKRRKGCQVTRRCSGRHLTRRRSGRHQS
eukprot:3604046-Prymnesium_polylepis.1